MVAKILTSSVADNGTSIHLFSDGRITMSLSESAVIAVHVGFKSVSAIVHFESLDQLKKLQDAIEVAIDKINLRTDAQDIGHNPAPLIDAFGHQININQIVVTPPELS